MIQRKDKDRTSHFIVQVIFLLHFFCSLYGCLLHADLFGTFDLCHLQTYRVKHSNRVHCRCTFEVRWLNPKLNGETVTVPSKSVMKLSDKDIDSHPAFAAFLTTLTRRNGVEFPSFLDLLEETTRETNLHGLLEKQIEEISKSADRLECPREVLLEAKRGMILYAAVDFD